jgi:NAD(P)-dependent dehydrogenase (short-subunit alcohol dehydrogenase family)
MTNDPTRPEVLVVTGTGGMGKAIARRMGAGHEVVLADVSEEQLKPLADAMREEGYSVHPTRTDISSADDVAELAHTANDLGTLRTVVHTAGVSPVQASSQRIVEVDVVGTALVLDEFLPYVQPGTVAVCIASMAGTMTELPAETVQAFATTPTDELSSLPALDPSTMEPGVAYGVAKRANQARVQAAAIEWGRRGGRVVSISPGIIATPQGNAELAGSSGDFMRQMIEMSATGRIGTPEDIAMVAEFLASPQASFITGTDILVDGGVIAALRTTLPQSPMN